MQSANLGRYIYTDVNVLFAHYPYSMKFPKFHKQDNNVVTLFVS